jgi:hypothetical protein
MTIVDFKYYQDTTTIETKAGLVRGSGAENLYAVVREGAALFEVKVAENILSVLKDYCIKEGQQQIDLFVKQQSAI